MITLTELPNCAGCGHEAQSHHTSWFPGGSIIIEECEDWRAQPACDCEHYLFKPLTDTTESGTLTT